MRRTLTTLFLITATVALTLVPLLAFAQDTPPPVDAGVAAAPDPMISGIVELVTHAKLGRTVLALVLGLKLLVMAAQRFGARLPGKVGAWFASPMAAGLLPVAAGLIGGVATTLANGGGLIDGLIGGVLVGVGAWLPTPGPKPEPVPAMTTAQAVSAFNKGPQP